MDILQFEDERNLFSEKDLFFAIKMGDLVSAEQLLKADANPNTCSVLAFVPGFDKGVIIKPLDYIVRRKDIQMLRLLMDFGLDISSHDELLQQIVALIWKSNGLKVETDLLEAYVEKNQKKVKHLMLAIKNGVKDDYLNN